MGTLGFMTIIDNKPTSIDDVTEFFLGIYMIIFAAILFLYELCWWQPFPAINRTFRKNFGFMYGLRSKGFYLIFIAFLCIGLYDEGESSIKGLDWASGLGWLGTGCFLVAVSHRMNTYQEVGCWTCKISHLTDPIGLTLYPHRSPCFGPIWLTSTDLPQLV